ncbi:xylan glycosyltransferase MUCI21-like [Nicotiana tomentosiformis]|uniref:xylan glycosyltransferase MUCI21-like n=1 Tax=Nicotiana tomentosiformis TaxID=4098 RepID=UPI00051C18CA|nr:beta-1,2-xylosyltransferase XYXT1-like [Nicotiana tomentosiformis]
MFKKMVQYQRYQQWKKGDEVVVCLDEKSQYPFGLVCENIGHSKRSRPKLLFLLLLSLVSFSFILAPYFFTSAPTFSLLYSFGFEDERLSSTSAVYASVCSSVSNGSICCDRSSIRSDICVMKGDVRTNSASSTITLYRDNDYGSQVFGASGENDDIFQHEKIKPYTRKWEKSVMDTIDELDLVLKGENNAIHQKCDVQHDVPAVFFSTGGYTGNLYHEFNDGILPLYITSQHFNKKVVFVILEYHDWWISKYENILPHLTEYPIIDFSGDNRTHCFPEAIVGLKIHDELTIDPSLMGGNGTIRDFRDMLDRAYLPRIRGLIQEEEQDRLALSPSTKTKIEMTEEKQELKKPKVVIIARNDSRAILNEDSLVKMAQDIGFQVEVLRPQRTTELARIYRTLNSSYVMIGVHGAAMTHFLFMRPESVFIQIVPLGTDWAADTYYGQPAVKLGLKYIGYKILPQESSLYNEYEKTDSVLTDPDSVNNRGWEFTKKIYLDRQNVRLNLRRFHKRLLRAYYYSVAKKNGRHHYQNQ